MSATGVAIIGGGIFVKEQHLPAVLSCELLSLKAIWSRSLRSAQETARLVPNSTSSPPDLYSSESGEGKSYDDLLRRPDIAAVILALPIPDQPGFIEKALAAGKHVLAEKPIAPHVATATELIAYHKTVSAENGTIFAIAENYRFNPGWAYGAEQVKKLGKVTGFVVRLNSNMSLDNKYVKTAWRAEPKYQGGFLLDGGVHHAAALRRLLGKEHAVASLMAQTSLVQSYLPPVDSINAVLKTKSGAVGSYIVSLGTMLSAYEFHIACEHGQVQAENNRVVTIRGAGQEARNEEKTFEKSTGVKEEVRAWAESLNSGKPHPDQTPELALGDLELVEKMLKSGDEDGSRQKLEHQHSPR